MRISDWSSDVCSSDLLAKAAAAHDLKIEAIENFSPFHWSDVLLDGPDKARQIEDLKSIIRAVGAAGIPVIGYNFSIAGVWGWKRGPFARGGALSVAFDLSEIDPEQPIRSERRRVGKECDNTLRARWAPC